MRLRQIDQEVELDWDVFEDFSEDNEQGPRVLISPLGEITSFEASFGGDEERILVLVNDEGLLEQQVKSN